MAAASGAGQPPPAAEQTVDRFVNIFASDSSDTLQGKTFVWTDSSQRKHKVTIDQQTGSRVWILYDYKRMASVCVNVGKDFGKLQIPRALIPPAPGSERDPITFLSIINQYKVLRQQQNSEAAAITQTIADLLPSFVRVNNCGAGLCQLYSIMNALGYPQRGEAELRKWIENSSVGKILQQIRVYTPEGVFPPNQAEVYPHAATAYKGDKLFLTKAKFVFLGTAGLLQFTNTYWDNFRTLVPRVYLPDGSSINLPVIIATGIKDKDVSLDTSSLEERIIETTHQLEVEYADVIVSILRMAGAAFCSIPSGNDNITLTRHNLRMPIGYLDPTWGMMLLNEPNHFQAFVPRSALGIERTRQSLPKMGAYEEVDKKLDEYLDLWKRQAKLKYIVSTIKLLDALKGILEKKLKHEERRNLQKHVKTLAEKFATYSQSKTGAERTTEERALVEAIDKAITYKDSIYASVYLQNPSTAMHKRAMEQTWRGNLDTFLTPKTEETVSALYSMFGQMLRIDTLTQELEKEWNAKKPEPNADILATVNSIAGAERIGLLLQHRFLFGKDNIPKSFTLQEGTASVSLSLVLAVVERMSRFARTKKDEPQEDEIKKWVSDQVMDLSTINFVQNKDFGILRMAKKQFMELNAKPFGFIRQGALQLRSLKVTNDEYIRLLKITTEEGSKEARDNIVKKLKRLFIAQAIKNFFDNHFKGKTTDADSQKNLPEELPQMIWEVAQATAPKPKG